MRQSVGQNQSFQSAYVKLAFTVDTPPQPIISPQIDQFASTGRTSEHENKRMTE